MTTFQYITLYILGLLPFLLLIAFGFWIIWNDRKREKLEQKESKPH